MVLIMLKKWTPLFDMDIERLDTIPVWVRLPGLPWEFWNPDSLWDLGNALEVFLEKDLSYFKNHQRRVARIVVLLNIRTDLGEHLNLIWVSTSRQQIMDYEWMSFRCHRYHETGYLARNFQMGHPQATT